MTNDDLHLDGHLRMLRFNSQIAVADTYPKEEYNRRPSNEFYSVSDLAIVARELERYKTKEMVVHPESQHNTAVFKKRGATPCKA